MADILDPYGRPARVEFRTLGREVARASLSGIRQPWSSMYGDPDLTPQTLATLLRDADQGNTLAFVELAEKIEERYPHYYSVLGTRKRAVSGLEPVIEPADDSADAARLADEARAMLSNVNFPALVEDCLDAIGKGWSAVEIIWSRRDPRRWVPADFKWRDPRWFRWDQQTLQELMLLTDARPADGEPLAAAKWIVHVPKLKSGIPARGGVARVAAWAYLITTYTVTDWMAFCEVFGLPWRVGRYGPTATKEEQRTLLNAVINLGSDAAAVVPESMRIDLHDGARTDGGALFQGLAEHADRATSKAVLGQTMTADSGSSRSQAEVHDHVRGDIRAADSRQLAGTLQRDLIRPFVVLNWGARERYPRLRIPVPDEQAKKRFADMVQELAQIGLRIPAAAIRSRLDLPAPARGEETVGHVPAPAAVNSAGPGRLETNAAAPRAEDILEEITAAGLAEWESDLGPVLDPVFRLARNAASYEEFRETLPDLLDEMDDRPWARRLAAATFTARGLGDASDG